jgi:hypothetical protein
VKRAALEQGKRREQERQGEQGRMEVVCFSALVSSSTLAFGTEYISELAISIE